MCRSQCSLVDLPVVPEAVEQVRPCEDLAGVLRQEREDLELGGRQLGGPARNVHFVEVVIDLEIGDARLPRRLAARSDRRLAGAPQQRANAREHFARRERLRDVVIGPELQADDAVRLVGACRQHDRRDARLRQRGGAQHVEPAAVRQSDVEQQHVGVLCRKASSAPATVPAISTARPSRSRYSRTTSATPASSSTIRTLLRPTYGFNSLARRSLRASRKASATVSKRGNVVGTSPSIIPSMFASAMPI